MGSGPRLLRPPLSACLAPLAWQLSNPPRPTTALLPRRRGLVRRVVASHSRTRTTRARPPSRAIRPQLPWARGGELAGGRPRLKPRFAPDGLGLARRGGRGRQVALWPRRRSLCPLLYLRRALSPAVLNDCLPSDLDTCSGLRSQGPAACRLNGSQCNVLLAPSQPRQRRMPASPLSLLKWRRALEPRDGLGRL